MTYDPNGQYPPPHQDPNAGGVHPTSGPSYPSSGAGYPTSGAAQPSGGPYPPQGGDPYQAGGYQSGGYQASSYPTSGYPGGGYDPAVYPTGGGGVDPATGQPLSDKTKLVAGLLGIFLGGFGVGRFYTGHTGLGVAQLLVSVFTCGAGALWGFIDGIMILVNGGTDAQGRMLRDS